MWRIRHVVLSLIVALWLTVLEPGNGTIAHAAIEPCGENETLTVVASRRWPVYIIGMPIQGLDGEAFLTTIQPGDFDFDPHDHSSWIATVQMEPEWSMYTQLCAIQPDKPEGGQVDCQLIELCGGDPGPFGIKPIRIELK